MNNKDKQEAHEHGDKLPTIYERMKHAMDTAKHIYAEDAYHYWSGYHAALFEVSEGEIDITDITDSSGGN